MPLLKKLAKQFLEGDEEAGEELELRAPSEVLGDMTLEEFATQMTEDSEFADDIYSRTEGSKYGSAMSPDLSDEEGDQRKAQEGRVSLVIEHLNLPSDETKDLAKELVAMLSGMKGKKPPSAEEEPTPEETVLV